jgi:hypothetical protein
VEGDSEAAGHLEVERAAGAFRGLGVAQVAVAVPALVFRGMGSADSTELRGGAHSHSSKAA